MQGALSVRTRALRGASSSCLLLCDSLPSLGLPSWYLLLGGTGSWLRTDAPGQVGQAGDAAVCSAEAGGVRGGEPRWEDLHEAAAGARRWARCSPLGRSALPRRGAPGSQCPSPALGQLRPPGGREQEGEPILSCLSAPGAPPLASRPRPASGLLLSSVTTGPRLTDELLEASDTAP